MPGRARSCASHPDRHDGPRTSIHAGPGVVPAQAQSRRCLRERLLQNWRRIDTDPEGYLRRILYNLAADGWRRQGRWRGRLAEFCAQARTPRADREDVAVVDLRDQLVRLLQQLPPRQRAVVVLRYWDQCTQAETAALLGCSEGTVKSAAARGLRRLQELAGSWPEPGSAGARDTKNGLRSGIIVTGEKS